jgi:hypothetical protein
MSESEFQSAMVLRLVLAGRRVLRVSDGTDARNGLYGLRALTMPPIDSTGADLLVLPREGIPCVLARNSAELMAAVKANDGPFFAELKDPFARKRRDQTEQHRWLEFVSKNR